ncbi:M56 family metallopeptidase [Ekhidna sp.]
MSSLITFYLEMLFVSLFFWLIHLLLRKHTGPAFRRFYLLGWLLFSVLFPLTSIQTRRAPDMNLGTLVSESIGTAEPNNEDLINDILIGKEFEESNIQPILNNNSSNVIEWTSIFFIIYIAISFFFMMRILLGLFQIFSIRRNAISSLEQGIRIYEVPDKSFKGASFFNWIFIGSSIYEGRRIIFKHELAHSELIHSFDILISQIYSALFWLNPFAWILRRIIGINTELEVDAKLLQTEERASYANTLLSLSQRTKPALMNHFSAHHLKSRIVALTSPTKHKNWTLLFSIVSTIILFFTVSCEKISSSEMLLNERMIDVRKITTRFTSHQIDTQQKTGKVVSIASYHPDGTLDEFVEQTTYPYDRKYEIKREFWQVPNKNLLPHIMDGLSLGKAENNFLYGHDWPAAYARNLKNKPQSGDFWRDIVEVDNDDLPNQILRKMELVNPDKFIELGSPERTEYFEYQDRKLMKIFSKTEYAIDENGNKTRITLRLGAEKSLTDDQKEIQSRMKKKSEIKRLSASYEYDQDLLTRVVLGDYERRFYYENSLLTKSEYFKDGEVLNTRIHYYDDGLKDRTEILNRYSEREYTIHYEYEFWEE